MKSLSPPPLGARMAAAPCWVQNSSCSFSEISQSGLSWPLQNTGRERVGEDPGEFPLGLSFFPKLLETQPPLTGPFSGRALVCRRGDTGQTLGFILPLRDTLETSPHTAFLGCSDLHRALGKLVPRP